MDYCGLPDDIASFFCRNQIQMFQVIEYNEHKHRLCLCYEQFGKRHLLKWNDIDAPFEAYYASLQKEYTIYKHIDAYGIAPHLEDESGFFVTEFLDDAVTLRQKLRELDVLNDEDAICRFIKSAMMQWEKYIRSVQGIKLDGIAAIDGYSQYRRYLNSLMLSGPFGTKCSLFRQWINKVIWKLLTFYKPSFCTNQIKKSKHGSYIIHGDFHANNILVSRGQVKLIDFEEIMYGSLELELAYFYSQIWKLIKTNKPLKMRIEYMVKHQFNQLMDVRAYQQVLRLYKLAVSFNPRY